jgi:flagellar biosynthesis anti-sigma factor FlgM
MKIENDKPNPLTNQTESLAPTAPTGASATGQAHGKHHHKSDELTLSPEAQLLQAAADAAAADPGVRKELVEKMRALLSEGKVGTDADQLADSLIDDVLKNR